jgi:hypothetical protein
LRIRARAGRKDGVLCQRRQRIPRFVLSRVYPGGGIPLEYPSGMPLGYPVSTVEYPQP